MCLFTDQLEPKIADKDIVCYKFVERTKTKGVYKSVFKGFEYVIRQLYPNNINIKDVDNIIHFCLDLPRIYYIEEGMFHSYINTSDSLKSDSQYAMLKCIIPKGAYYYEDTNISSCYASSQIKILEEI